MPGTNFAGALAAMALGAVLAFAIQNTPKDFDLRTAGVILILAGAGDLIIRSLMADSPLLGPRTADVAAVLEPVGEPVLDAAGNPITVPNPAAVQSRPPLIAPLPGTMPRDPAPDTLVVTDHGVTRIPSVPFEPVPLGHPGMAEAGYRATTPSDYGSAYEAAVRAESVDPLDTPESPVALTTISGRPVRPRGRGFARARRGPRRG